MGVKQALCGQSELEEGSEGRPGGWGLVVLAGSWKVCTFYPTQVFHWGNAKILI